MFLIRIFFYNLRLYFKGKILIEYFFYWSIIVFVRIRGIFRFSRFLNKIKKERLFNFVFFFLYVVNLNGIV